MTAPQTTSDLARESPRPFGGCEITARTGVGAARLEWEAAPPRQDQHSVTVDYDVFVNVPRLDAKDLESVQKVYTAEGLDFRLKAGSAAVDRGVAIANVTEGFTGRAPDLGALEFGQPLTTYGPRR